MANGPVLRKRVGALSASELSSLRDAYRRMMRISDNRGYNYLAGLHGVPDWYCWHGPRSIGTSRPYHLFLPWHRAYMRYFELAILRQNPGTALPWWDWASGQSIPAAFSAERADGQPNPLFKARINVPTANPPLNRDTTRFPGETGGNQNARLPTRGEIAALYRVTQFEEFSTGLEGIHNRIHMWTGGIRGDMSNVNTAAYDPIFWSHHCMIDRVWYLWQLKNGINNIPAEYMSVVLAPFRYTVRDVLNIGAIGYEYAAASVTIQA